MIENQLTELIAALTANTTALRDVIANAGSPQTHPTQCDTIAEDTEEILPPIEVKLKKAKPVVIVPAPKPAVEETAVEETAVEETAVEETAVEETAVEETAVGDDRTPDELRLAITEQVKAALTAPDAITKNAKAKWEAVRTDHGIGKLAEATDAQLPSILAAVLAL